MIGNEKDRYVINQVFKTSNYELFKFWDSNRPTKQSHILKLKKSIQKRNLNKYFPVLCFKDGTVFDGQHRVLALKALGLPVIYRVIEDELDLEELLLVNQNVKRWDLEAFILVYAKLGREPYIRYRNDLNGFGINTSIISGILTGSSGGLSREIEEGELIYEEKHTEKIKSFLNEMNHADIPLRREYRMVRAYRFLRLKQGFKLDHLKKQIIKHGKEFQEEYLKGYRRSKGSCCLYLQNVYNKGITNKEEKLWFTGDEINGED